MKKDCKCTNCGCGKMTTEELIKQANDQTIPYTEEIISESEVIRTFEPNQPAHLFKWHWDEEDRLVYVMNDNDWKFQYDNEIPIKLEGCIDIPKDVMHRVIPGSSGLILKINKII